MSSPDDIRERRAYIRFREAVSDISADPSPDNVAAYLVASRALEESRRRRPSSRIPVSRGREPALAS